MSAQSSFGFSLCFRCPAGLAKVGLSGVGDDVARASVILMGGLDTGGSGEVVMGGGLVHGALSQVLDARPSQPSILVGTLKQRRAPREQEFPGDAMCTSGASCRQQNRSGQNEKNRIDYNILSY